MRRGLVRSCLVSASVGAVLTLGPGTARAEDGTAPAVGKPYRAIDVQAGVMTHLFPRTMFGADAAFVIGTERFMARFGAQVYGGRAFDL
ncbi:MAG TPA: hypothetical protein VFG69_05435, partial [Nannocystaceae bacterium]|nr:hypothetical protein [Nannocystaceae bacterium]